MKNKTVFAVFGGAVCVAAAVRLAQMLALTEYKTGFITRGTELPFYLLSAVILIFAVLVPAFAVINKPVAKDGNSFYIATSVFSLFTGLAVIFDVFLAPSASVPAFLGWTQIILGALTAAYLTAFGLRAFVHFPLSPKFAALPPAFFTVRAATVFIACSSRAVTSDTVFDVCVYALLMLLFLEIARAANGAGSKAGIKKIVFFGLSVSLLAICSSFPKLMLALIYSTALHDGAASAVLPFAVGLYAAAVVFSRLDFVSGEKRKMGVYYVGKH